MQDTGCRIQRRISRYGFQGRARAPALPARSRGIAVATRIAPRLHEIHVEPLLLALYRRRAANRLTGMAAVVVSVAVLGYLNMDRIVLQGGW